MFHWVLRFLLTEIYIKGNCKIVYFKRIGFQSLIFILAKIEKKDLASLAMLIVFWIAHIVFHYRF